MKAFPFALALGLLLPAKLAAQCEIDVLGPGPPATGFARSLDVSGGLDGGRVLIGAMLDDDVAISAGAAYVCEYSAAGFVAVAKLTGSDTDISAYFGQYLAIEGDVVAVGANDDELGVFAGAVYVFERGPAGWTETKKLLASDGGVGDDFGDAIDVDGGRIAIGAPDNHGGRGAVYFFEKGPGSWTEVLKLEPDPAENATDFGIGLDLDGNRLLVGADQIAYVYEEVGGVWSVTGKLTESDAAGSDGFGERLSLDGDTAAVTAPYQTVGSTFGAAYVYELVGAIWVETKKLLPLSGGAKRFGTSVDVAGDHVAVGSTKMTSFGGIGSVSIFHREGGWATGKEINGAGNFGDAVKLWDGAVLIGDSTFGGEVPLVALDGEAGLYAGPEEVSMSAGGEQSMLIGSCAKQAGFPYFLVGSITGTAPATPVGQVALPLVVDGYTLLTIAQPGVTLTNGAGVLDGSGKALASFHLPPGTDPTLIGLRAYHAALILQENFKPAMATGAVAVEILP